MDIDKRFEEAKIRIVGIERERIGIGMLGEKTLHAILKNFYEPDEDCQEIPIEGYVADIFSKGHIIEIQTGQFQRMREKLKAFLPTYPVTIVYPVSEKRQLRWIDPETGEIQDGRATKKLNYYQIFPELYKIKSFLKEKNLKITIIVLDMEEYKLLNGWGEKKKNHASKYDRVPNRVVREIHMECPRDYMQFLPIELEGEFTVKQFAKVAKCTQGQASVTMNILYEMEVVDRVGKQGNAYIYRINEI